MDVNATRQKLFRLPVMLTISKEFKEAREWDEEEIAEIVDLMARSFNNRSTTLFYRNGAVILGSYFLLDFFATDVPFEVVGMVFIMYGAILAGYSINGPYRIAIEGLDGGERYDLIKREMARDSMFVTMGAIYFVLGFHIRIFLAIW